MSVPVDLAVVRERIEECGPYAFAVSVNDRGCAHVVSVTVRINGDELVMRTGRSTRANLKRNSKLTLLWPMLPDPAHSMIVDANARMKPGDESEVIIEPYSAVLHRVASATGEGPSCVPLG